MTQTHQLGRDTCVMHCGRNVLEHLNQKTHLSITNQTIQENINSVECQSNFNHAINFISSIGHKMVFKSEHPKDCCLFNDQRLKNKNHFAIVQLRSKFGFVGHCVAISDSQMFDSNSGSSKPLNKDNMDECCSDHQANKYLMKKDEYDGIEKMALFQTLKTTTEKRKRKRK